MSRTNRRPSHSYRPQTDSLEGRLLLSGSGSRHVLALPAGYSHPVRPNTPVLPFAVASNPTFIDPTVQIENGNGIAVSSKALIAPYVNLDARRGTIRIGSGSAILDSAQIVASDVQIGSTTVISAGATVMGQSTVGGYGSVAKPTYVGPNAVIDGATIAPGAYVSALARVGPGLFIPAGYKVLPGANVTTEDQVLDPALGLVGRVAATDTTNVNSILSNATALANGYTSLYQANSATGTLTPSTTPTGVFSGNLATVEGVSAEAGSAVVSFEPKGAQSPQFLSRTGTQAQVNSQTFHARITGQAIFSQRPAVVQSGLGHHVSIRADAGQPIKFGSIGRIGNSVSIYSPVSGAITIANDVMIGNNVVITGSGTSTTTTLGDNATIGVGAVITGSTIGAGATIGANSYIAGSTIAVGESIAAGTILINGKIVGTPG
jgi:carbonic anhydrase/acetyltransferase-like protein (isoleucine patch superfamily)